MRSATWRLPVRLAQSSPVLAAVLFATVLFTIPAMFATGLINMVMSPEGPGNTPADRASWVDYAEASDAAIAAGLTGGPDAFDAASEKAWTRWTDGLPADLTTAGLAAELRKPTGAAFEPVAAWEHRTGGKVWAWMVPSPPRPSLVASGIGDPSTMELVQAEIDRDRVIPAEPGMPAPALDIIDKLWEQYTLDGGAVAPLRPDIVSPYGGGGGSGGYMVSSASVFAGGRLWRAYAITADRNSNGDTVSVADYVAGLDPGAVGFEKRLQAVAKKRKVNLFILGPLDMVAVPLRTPAGADRAQAITLGRLAWPALAIPEHKGDPEAYRKFDRTTAALAGGPAGVMRVVSIFNSSIGAGISYGPEEIAPQTVAFLAVLDSVPGGSPTALESAWRSWRVFASGYFPQLIGGTGALLLLSLIASPAAFVYERRRLARERVADEIARMRRDVHDKVYNRLSALSKRVAEASGGEPGGAASLSAMAEEIRSTVGELQEILGDEVRHTDSTLTVVPLADQVASVCAAQGARLGAEVRCAVAEGVPEPPARLGWDIQCIVEEAITNAVRHGGAAHIRVSVEAGPDGGLALSVTDDGSGSRVCDPLDAPAGSTGLRNMQARLTRWGGALGIEADETGTVLTVRLPPVRG
ncbi:MAG: hypothetical protein Q7W30_01645 [Coriobacteriia bacterium]|nr:hypothetical protein [Coriobacteriia bacterium]